MKIADIMEGVPQLLDTELVLLDTVQEEDLFPCMYLLVPHFNVQSALCIQLISGAFEHSVLRVWEICGLYGP